MYYLLAIAFHWIPFRSIPGTILVSIPEWVYSAGLNCPRNFNLAEPSANFYSAGFHRIPPE